MDETQQEYFASLPFWLQRDIRNENARKQRREEQDLRELMNPLLKKKTRKKKVLRQAALDETVSIKRKSRRMVGDFSILDED